MLPTENIFKHITLIENDMDIDVASTGKEIVSVTFFLHY